MRVPIGITGLSDKRRRLHVPEMPGKPRETLLLYRCLFAVYCRLFPIASSVNSYSVAFVCGTGQNLHPLAQIPDFLDNLSRVTASTNELKCFYLRTTLIHSTNMASTVRNIPSV